MSLPLAEFMRDVAQALDECHAGDVVSKPALMFRECATALGRYMERADPREVRAALAAISAGIVAAEKVFTARGGSPS